MRVSLAKFIKKLFLILVFIVHIQFNITVITYLNRQLTDLKLSSQQSPSSRPTFGVTNLENNSPAHQPLVVVVIIIVLIIVVMLYLSVTCYY